MRRKPAEPSRHVTRQPQNALGRYLAALEEVYPAARGKAHITVRPDNRVIVSIPLPMRVSERMRLFDQMAEVGTKLLLETDRYIILSGR
ncbi:MAG: hypothetical protein RMM98_17845 [Acidobacteriota bacterium]|nr:hypothetical protein [Blastocatellia bacterium]MDW8241467.1 hypothetical protein [Acidobacteriota bacterium]